jgi:cytochrome c peroxidase
VKFQHIGFLALAALSLLSCEEWGGKKPHVTTPYVLQIPTGMPQPALPEDNPLTVEGILLGRQLFYDPILSLDSSQSCASCHNPAFGFTDNGSAFSVGVDGSVGDRNSMPLHNLAWHQTFFWDGRSPSLREQALDPISNPIEMKEDVMHVVVKLQRQPRYQAAFEAAFGEDVVTPERMGLAMEQFMLTILSGGESKFDRFEAGLESLTPEEELGLQLFNGESNPNSPTPGADCFHCHGGALFTNHKFMNNGLDSSLTDLGLGAVTGKASDDGKFKVPSLRNIAYTAPYMHDGRFQTLEQVIEFYDSGVAPNSPNLDPSMVGFVQMHSGATGLNLTLAQRQALVAFLNTLTDTRIETDTLYLNPFQ